MPIVDDYSRMTFVYFLQNKSQAFSRFQEYLAMAERQVGLQLKQFRTDRVGELTSSEFYDFCSQRGILKQVTVPYSSQMNGVAEIKNQVLQFQARTMLIQAKLGTSYWAEAVDMANYVLNQLPSSALGGKIRYALWTGRLPTLKHLKFFGSPAYVFIPDKHRKKFDPQAEKMLLVGYMDDMKAYKLLHPVTHRPQYARSIIVDEGYVFHNVSSQHDLSDAPSFFDPEAAGEDDGDIQGIIQIQQTAQSLMRLP